jgi:hypothetical protein
LVSDSAHGNFHPISGGNIFGATSYAIPDFTWSDAPTLPPVPQGTLGNTISADRESNPRTSSGPPGAYAQAIPICDGATLSADLKLHVPVISYGGAYFEADFDMVPGSLRFRLKNVSSLTRPVCGNPALLTQRLEIFRLYIPKVIYGGASYWVYLQYVPGNGSTDAIFTLTSVGANKS